MKLSNCGRCGLEPEVLKSAKTGGGMPVCPCCEREPWLTRTVFEWNAVQFAARTERINAAAVALMAASFSPDCGMWTAKDAIADATILIDEQDAAARVRWAEMRGE